MNKPLTIKNTHNRLFRRNQNMPDQDIDKYLKNDSNLPVVNENREKIKKMGLLALDHQRRNFSDISMCKKIEEIYLDLIES